MLKPILLGSVTKMKIKNFVSISVLLLIVTISAINLNYTSMMKAFSFELPTQYPLVYVYPEDVTVNVGDYFTISVVVYNLTDTRVQDPENPTQWIPLGNLYGFDIQFSWDPTIIKYVNHTVTVPVEDYPNPIPPSPYPGILHTPTFETINIVNETGNIPYAADPRVRAWFAFVSIAPATPFNGNGTLFTMTFQAIKKGISPLEIVDCTLADKNAEPIAKHKCNQYSGQWLIPPRSGEVKVGAPPKVNFTYWPDIGVVGLPINFTAIVIQNASNIQTFMWDFGDGTRQNTTDPMVQHTYTNPSFEYTITLKALDSEGVESNLVTRKVTVVQSRDLKAVGLSASHKTIKPNMTFALTAKIRNIGTAPFTFYENCTIDIYFNITTVDRNNQADLGNHSKWQFVDSRTKLAKYEYPPPISPAPEEEPFIFNSTQLFGEYVNDAVYLFKMEVKGIPVEYEANVSDNVAVSDFLLYTIREFAQPKIVKVYYGYAYQKTFKKPLIENENLTISYSVTNLGTLSGNFTISTYLNGSIIKVEYVIVQPALTEARSIEHKITARGKYNITIEVKTIEGYSDSWQDWLQVIKTPKLNVTWSPKVPSIGQTVTFDASATIHQEPNVSIRFYTWRIYAPNVDPDTGVVWKSYSNDTVISLSFDRDGEWTIIFEVQDVYGLKYDAKRPLTKDYRMVIKLAVGGGGFPVEWIAAAILIIAVVVTVLFVIIRRRRRMIIPKEREEE